jgi:hypothetical protein
VVLAKTVSAVFQHISAEQSQCGPVHHYHGPVTINYQHTSGAGATEPMVLLPLGHHLRQYPVADCRIAGVPEASQAFENEAGEPYKLSFSCRSNLTSEAMPALVNDLAQLYLGAACAPPVPDDCPA